MSAYRERLLLAAECLARCARNGQGALTRAFLHLDRHGLPELPADPVEQAIRRLERRAA